MIGCNEKKLIEIVEDALNGYESLKEEATPEGREFWSHVSVKKITDVCRKIDHVIAAAMEYSATVKSEFMDGDKDEPAHWCHCSERDYELEGSELVIIRFDDYGELAMVEAFGEEFPC